MPALFPRTDSVDGKANLRPTPTAEIPWRRIVVVVAFVLLPVIVVATAWLNSRLNGSLTSLTRGSLIELLSAKVTSAELWLDDQRRFAEQVASDPRVSGPALELLSQLGDRQAASLGEILGAESFRQLTIGLNAAVASQVNLGWVVLDPQGTIIASDRERLMTFSLDVPQEFSRRLNRGESTVSYALATPVPLTTSGPQSRSGGPIMLAMSPLRSGVTTVGCVAVVLDPVAGFSAILSPERVLPSQEKGEKPETYAFNRAGRMVSQIRSESQLRRIGLLPSDARMTSVLNVEVRDPGADLTRDERASNERSLQPLTLMAGMAIRGGHGENFDGYNDYRGVPVVGVWQWLDDYEIGIATEIEVAHAYAPTRLLGRAVWTLVGIISLASLGMLAVLGRERRKIRKASRAGMGKRSLGQYEIGRRIGCGGMGTVYLGQHELLRRDVAVKVLQGNELSPRAISRFEREVQATAKLRHPNTIAIFDFGRTEDNEFFYVMEWVDGITLDQLIRDYGRQPPERVIYLLLQVCGSLSEAHHKGIVHRDVKPANIMITAHSELYDTVKLLDFGLVKELDSESTILTVSESMTGTPTYMSPEAVRDAAKSDHRSDLYSLGAVGYALLTGVPVFEGGSAVDVCVKQLHEEPVRPSTRIGSRLPEDLQNVLMSCLRKFPEERPRSVDELAATLQNCADAARWSMGEARRWWEHIYQASETLDDDPGDETLLSGDVFELELDPDRTRA